MLLTRWLKAVLFRLLGRRALRAQNLRTALTNFQKAAEQQPENLDSTIQTAWCLYRLENYEAAIEKHDQVLQRNAGCATARAYRALSLARVHRLKEAVEETPAGSPQGFPVKGEKSPGFWEGTLGTWLADIGNHAEAIESLRRSIELEPNDANTHCTLGVCFSETRQLDRAVDSYLQAIPLRPDYADAHFNLGCTYGEMGRASEEIDAYKRVVEIDPDDRKALINLAIAYSQSGWLEWWRRPTGRQMRAHFTICAKRPAAYDHVDRQGRNSNAKRGQIGPRMLRGWRRGRPAHRWPDAHAFHRMPEAAGLSFRSTRQLVLLRPRVHNDGIVEHQPIDMTDFWLHCDTVREDPGSRSWYGR